MTTTTKLPRRRLGKHGPLVSVQGLGCMGMTAFYVSEKKLDDETSIQVIGKALEAGINFLDTAWIYQNFQTGEKNEELVGKALKRYGRNNFVVATKFGILPGNYGFSSTPETIRKQLGESLKRLDIDCIDLYYQHRPDPKTPIEVVVNTLKELINEGKIKYIGLSECTADQLRRAHVIHPVTAIQMEYSLQTRDIEKEILPTARELGVAIVAYSPLGRGLLSNTFERFEDIKANDRRKQLPRFTKENFEKNQQASKKLTELAKKKNCTVGQLALAWVHSQGEDMFPIPGTTKVENLLSNASSFFVQLSSEEKRAMGTMLETFGSRY